MADTSQLGLGLKHRDPATLEEFEERWARGARFVLEGNNPLEARITIPCPFCAAPDFVSFAMLDVEMATGLEQVCHECERGLILEIKKIPMNGGGVRWEFVQTCGDDPPAYLPPIRRLVTDKGGDA